MWRQMAFGTRVDAIGHGESRKRSSIGECAKGQLIESELAETSPAQRMGLRAVSQQLRKRVLGRKEPSTAPAAERPRKWGQDAAAGRSVGLQGGPPRTAQAPNRSQTERCGGAPAGVTAPPHASGLSDNPGRLVGHAGRQAGGQGGGQGRQAGRQVHRQRDW